MDRTVKTRTQVPTSQQGTKNARVPRRCVFTFGDRIAHISVAKSALFFRRFLVILGFFLPPAFLRANLRFCVLLPNSTSEVGPPVRGFWVIGSTAYPPRGKAVSDIDESWRCARRARAQGITISSRNYAAIK